MKKLHSLALGALLAPALALASGAAIAQEPRTNTDRQQTQSQNPNDPQSRDMSRDTTTQPNRDLSRDTTTQPNRDMSRDTTTQPNRGMSGDTTKSTLPGDRSQAAAGQSKAHGTFLSNKPARGFHADKLIGKDVKAQAGGDDVGTISDLIIDEDGQVVAVIVGVGGFLGMGEKDVAIEWDSLERTAKSGGDDYEYRVNATRDTLTTAPAYKK